MVGRTLARPRRDSGGKDTMSNTARRAAAGLALALGLAATAAPALGAGSDAEDGVIRAAAVSTPRVVGTVDEAAVPSPSPVIDQLADRLVAHAAAVEHLRAVEHLQAVERWNAAVAANEARAAEEARQAEEARRAEAEQAAAASAPAGSVEAVIQRWFGSASATAIRIARCESGLNPRAVSTGGGNHGLFQINSVHRGTFESVTGQPWSAVYTAEANTRFAHWLWSQQGWGPWTCA